MPWFSSDTITTSSPGDSPLHMGVSFRYGAFVGPIVVVPYMSKIEENFGRLAAGDITVEGSYEGPINDPGFDNPYPVFSYHFTIRNISGYAIKFNVAIGTFKLND